MTVKTFKIGCRGGERPTLPESSVTQCRVLSAAPNFPSDSVVV